MVPQEENTHARLSMSRLPRIIQCPGSVPLYEDYCEKEGPQEEKSSAAANEGTYLHEVTEDHLTREVYEVVTRLHEDPTKHRDFKSWVEENLQWVWAIRATHRPKDPLFVEYLETKVSLKGYCEELNNPLLEESEGTCDYMFVTDHGTTLNVTDWKYGHGLVYPDSEQLLGYAAAALKSLPSQYNIQKVVTHIGQPRAEDDCHKSAEFTIQDIIRWVKFTLSPALEQTLIRPYILNPSDKACQFCPMKVRCSARRDLNLIAAQKAFAVYAQMPGVLNLDEIAEALEVFEGIAKYKNDLLKFAYNELTSGRPFPGRKIVQKGGRRAWTDEQKTAAVLEEQGIELEEVSEVKMLSPAGVEKVIGKKRAKEDWFTELCPKGAGSLTLVKDSDPRPAVELGSITERFAEFIEED